MAGINLAKINKNSNFKTSLNEEPCIFLSHSSFDKDKVEKINEYITQEWNINTYFDKEDNDLQSAVDEGCAEKITACIEKGISNSVHLMCIYSSNTVRSWWVSYEVGYAKKSSTIEGSKIKGIATLKLKGDDVCLPSFLENNNILDIKSLDEYLEKLNKNRPMHNFVDTNHPLNNYMDWNVTHEIQTAF